MEFDVFKALQGLLFFGAALGLGIWQLIDVQRATRTSKKDQRPED